MKKALLYSCVLVSLAAASSVVLCEVNGPVKSSAIKGSVEVEARKLTLTLGQSAHSVKMDPSLNDQINEEAFIKGVSAYMNQPFDFTYRQGSFSFNVPRTHTLSLFATQEKLSDIAVEIPPLFQDDFEGAFKLVESWEGFFDRAGLRKNIYDSDIPLNKLREKFNSISHVRCGFNTASWFKDNTEFSIGIDRFERQIYNVDTRQAIAKPVYKVSINIRSVERK